MIYIGIDIAKDKHDCFITNSDGEVLFHAFTISNNRDGFDALYQKIESVSDDITKIKVGLEATGHYALFVFTGYGILIHGLNCILQCHTDFRQAQPTGIADFFLVKSLVIGRGKQLK